jgi:predicted nucleic acid-binding protein
VTAYVLDASVAAKWFLPPAQETLTSEALRLLGDYAGGRLRLLVPDLFWPEFGNILWKAVRQRRISSESAAEAVEALTERNIPTAPSASLLKDAFAIAEAFDRTVYDGMYVALAVASNAPLVTADERLANALAARLPVRWLGEFEFRGEAM